MKVLIISGHGAGDPGAIAKIKGKKFLEATETVIMAKKLKTALNKYSGISVSIYPTSRDAYADVLNKKCKVNFADYDYILELHFNACVKDLKGNGKTTGVEIFVTKNDTTSVTEDYIVKAVASVGLKNRGVRRANYTVINAAKKAGKESALLEICFLDDADDMAIYTKNKDKIALKIAEGISKGYKLKKKSAAKKLEVGSKIKIKVGAKDGNTKAMYKDFVYKNTYNVIWFDGNYVVFGVGNAVTGKTKKSNCIVQ